MEYDISREAAKTSALLPGKIEKYDYLTGEKLLPLSQRRITEQARFTYSLAGKTFEKFKKKQLNFKGKNKLKL